MPNDLSRSLIIAATNEEEKERWLEDLNMAIVQADTDPKMPYLNLKSCSKFHQDLLMISSRIIRFFV